MDIQEIKKEVIRNAGSHFNITDEISNKFQEVCDLLGEIDEKLKETNN